MENYLRGIVIRNIDHRNIDISKVVEGEITIPLSAFESITKRQLTKGILVVSNFNFARPDQINDLFSKTLNLDFFASIKEIGRLDRHNYFCYAEPLNRNWKKFIEIFDLRNKLVHEKEQTMLSVKQLRSLCNCPMNFVDACQVVCDPKLRLALKARLRWLREREASRDQKRKRDSGNICLGLPSR